MNPSLEETIILDFITSNPTTGAAADADATPTFEVFEDATDVAILSDDATKRDAKTGNYRVSVACTTGNGFEAGKSYNVVALATVAGVAGKGVIGSFQVRTKDIDGLVVPDVAGTAAALHAITNMYIGDIAAAGAALNRAAESAVVTVGTETNTFAKTDSHDSDYHSVAAVGGEIDYYYQFDIDGGAPVNVSILGRLDEGVVPSGGDSVGIYAYDWIGLDWDRVEPPTGPFTGIFGSDPTDDVQKTSILFARHVSPLGKVRIRIFADDLEADTEMFVDLIYVEYAIVPDVAGTAAALHVITDGKVDANSTQLAALLALAECDYAVDVATMPFELIVLAKGTATELLRKKLYQADGSPVTSVNHLVGQHQDTAIVP